MARGFVPCVAIPPTPAPGGARAAHLAHLDLLVAEVCRHLPSVAPALRLMFTHALDGRPDRIAVCCEAGQPIDP